MYKPLHILLLFSLLISMITTVYAGPHALLKSKYCSSEGGKLAAETFVYTWSPGRSPKVKFLLRFNGEISSMRHLDHPKADSPLVASKMLAMLGSRRNQQQSHYSYLRLRADTPLTTLTLQLPLAVFNSPVSFANSGGAFSGTATLKSQLVHTFLGTGSVAGVPSFIQPSWADLTGTPTTVSGYNITDAVATSGAQNIAGAKTYTDNPTIAGAKPALKFKETAGNTTTYFEADPTGNTFSLKHPVYAGGGPGSAISFNGTNQYGTFNRSSLAGLITNTITTSFWIKPIAYPPANNTLINYGSSGGGQHGIIMNNVSLGGGLRIVGNGGTITGFNTVAPPLNTWTHCVLVVDGSINKMTFYANGIQTGVVTGGVNLNFANDPTIKGSIGAILNASNNPSAYTNVEIDQILVYNTALTAADVASIYNNGLGQPSPPTAGLLRRWEFDEGAGTTAASLTGNGDVLSLVNNPLWDLKGKTPNTNSIQTATGFSFMDGTINNERGIFKVGDVQGGAELQGRAIRHMQNNRYTYLQGLDGHIVVDPLVTMAAPDSSGSYNRFAIQKWGTGDAQTGQTQYATQTTAVNASEQRVGVHWWDGSRMRVVNSASTVAEYAYRKDFDTYAMLSSPQFSGTPKAPTAADTSNSQQIATTAFVKKMIAATPPAVTSIQGTTDQVSVSNATGSFTLSLPQAIAKTSTPTFGGVNVNGQVHAKSVKVDVNVPVPDYVFKPGYKLPELKEVALYIQAKSHLPGIPSAARVTKEGMDVVDMNLRLLKKVEELTLYLIEKDQVLKKLEHRMHTMEKKLYRYKATKALSH